MRSPQTDPAMSATILNPVASRNASRHPEAAAGQSLLHHPEEVAKIRNFRSIQALIPVL